MSRRPLDLARIKSGPRRCRSLFCRIGIANRPLCL